MPIANTVEANIVVNFEDRFSGPACKAFEKFRKCAEAALQALNPALTALFIRIESGIDNFVNAIDRFALAVDSLVNGMVQKNKEVLTFGESLKSVGQFIRNFWEDLKSLSTVQATATSIGIAVGLASLAALVANFPLFSAAFAASVYLIIEAWDTLKAIEKIKLEVKLKDEATTRAVVLRQQLEGTFRDPIIQEIQVLQRNLSGPVGAFPGAGNPGLDDALITLERSAPLSSPLGLDLEPQFDFPSFSSGIRFVPRDMLANIHKGETVLPRSQAEQFRRGGSGGDNITFNITGGLVPDQATARKFARMLEGERIRINERRSV